MDSSVRSLYKNADVCLLHICPISVKIPQAHLAAIDTRPGKPTYILSSSCCVYIRASLLIPADSLLIQDLSRPAALSAPCQSGPV